MRQLARCGGVRRGTAGLLALVGALTFMVAGAFGDAGNPIPNTILARTHDNGNGTITVNVKGEWNCLSHSADCNYDRAATGAAVLWGDRNGADYARTITTAARATTTVTLTVPTQAW